MNGRHARGWGISAHDRMNTTTKKAANSIVGKLTAGILSGAAVALACFAPAAGAFQGAGDAVLVVGDSLEVGSGPYLQTALPGVDIELDAEKGRSSAQGVRVVERRLGPEHGVVVFPLGTNDSPANAGGLAASLAAVQRLAGGRCIVVATIARPPLGGVSAAGLNRVVETFAAQTGAQVMDWRSAVASEPELLGRDHVHATAAATRCAPACSARPCRAACSAAGRAASPPRATPTPGRRATPAAARSAAPRQRAARPIALPRADRPARRPAGADPVADRRGAARGAGGGDQAGAGAGAGWLGRASNEARSSVCVVDTGR